MYTKGNELIRKTSRLERWLATHVPFFAHRWNQRIRSAYVEEAHAELVAARADLCVAASRFVDSLGWELAYPDEVAWRRATLTTMVCRERNALLQYIELTGGPECRDQAGKLMEEASQPPRAKPEESAVQ